MIAIAGILFFAVPLVLWLMVAAPRRSSASKAHRIGAVIAGGDNRLSLSRAQAFAWTMVIFGSYAAATAIHLWPTPVSAATQNAADAQAAQAANDVKASETAQQKAESAAAEARKSGHPDDAKDKAAATARETTNAAKKRADDAKKHADDLRNGVRQLAWVVIPKELLALAGISIASGVFAAAISASADTGVRPLLTSMVSKPAASLPANSNPSTGPNWYEITGTGLGRDGQVRINGQPVRLLYWKDDGTSIGVDAVANPTRIVVDTANGKLAYMLNGLVLGAQQMNYEWGDLFRDDANPRLISLTKFQMFGWTVVALVIYCVMFWTELLAGQPIDKLPIIDSTIVILTGLTQSGYLGGKIASNNASAK